MTNRPTVCPYIGAPVPLPSVMLPTEGDILRHYLHVRNQAQRKNTFTVEEIADCVAKDVFDIWKEASITTVLAVSIMPRVVRLYKRYQAETEWYIRKETKRDTASSMNRINKKRHEFESRLFDVARCKSKPFPCSCEICKSGTNPGEDVDYLQEQRTTHRQTLDDARKAREAKWSSDEMKKLLARQEAKRKRLESEEKRKRKQLEYQQFHAEYVKLESSEGEMEEEELDGDKSADFQPSKKKTKT